MVSLSLVYSSNSIRYWSFTLTDESPALCLSSFRNLIIFSALNPNIRSIPHKIYYTNIFPYNLRLKAILFIRFPCIVHLTKIFFFEDYFHTSFVITCEYSFFSDNSQKSEHFVFRDKIGIISQPLRRQCDASSRSTPAR